jgi:imidazoleglycerol-phosphate dehydratase
MRKASTKRKSKETDISCRLILEDASTITIATPINFLNHMLETFAKHGNFGLLLKALGDTHIDQHHTVEDAGIALGQAFKKAIGDMQGINRAGSFAFPMDESLGIVAVDVSGRPHVVFKADFSRREIGDFDSDLTEEFFKGFANGLGANIAIYVPYGKNDHHKLEAIFKAFERALQNAVDVDEKREGVTSTKDVIDFIDHDSP